MNILLLGAGGFIGSHLVEALIHQGKHAVTGVDITDEKLAGIEGPNFSFVDADVISDRTTVDELIDEVELVVDLIAYARIRASKSIDRERCTTSTSPPTSTWWSGVSSPVLA